MLLAKSRPIVVISMTGGSHFARERLTAFTPWHLDAVSGSHPPHLLMGVDRIGSGPQSWASKFAGYEAQTAHAGVEGKRAAALAPPSHGRYAMKLVGPTAMALSCLCFHAGIALADDT